MNDQSLPQMRKLGDLQKVGTFYFVSSLQSCYMMQAQSKDNIVKCHTGGGIEEEGLDDNRPPAAASDEFAVSEDEMDDFIDDDEGDGTRRRGRVRSRGAPKGVSSYGMQVSFFIPSNLPKCNLLLCTLKLQKSYYWCNLES